MKSNALICLSALDYTFKIIATILFLCNLQTSVGVGALIVNAPILSRVFVFGHARIQKILSIFFFLWGGGGGGAGGGLCVFFRW